MSEKGALCIDGSRKVEKASDHPPGMYSASGTLLIESPNRKQIERAVAADARVTYFHFREVRYIKDEATGLTAVEYHPTGEEYVNHPSNDTRLASYDLINGEGAPYHIFNNSVVNQLTEYVRQRYGGQNIAVRGVACSLGEVPIVVGENLITNPAQIAQLGAEKASKYAPQIGFSAVEEELPSRSVEWLIGHPQQLRERAVKEGKVNESRQIFPALIIYDRTKFSDDDTVLPTDPKERSRVVKEVIVLDYPLTRDEFRAQQV